jgi:putative ABC transport system permease protein
MKLLPYLRSLTVTLFHRTAAEAELNDEFRTPIQRHADDLERAGLPRHEAERRARIAFGSLGKAKEDCREQRPAFRLEILWQDIRFGLRQLRRTPGFTAIAVFTLALGIGGTTAIFSVIDALLLRGSPFRNPRQLVQIEGRDTDGGLTWVSRPDFRAFAAQLQPDFFAGLASYVSQKFLVLTGTREPDLVWACQASNNLFDVLGANAVVGRTFTYDDSQAVILSDQYWRIHYAANPNAIGKTLALNGRPYTVIGIAPANLEFPDPHTEAWIPLLPDAAEETNHKRRILEVIARLNANATLKSAQAAINVLTARLATQYPATNAGWATSVKVYHGRNLGAPLRAAIFALLGAVVSVLLIVCSNVSSMLLARGGARQGEMAIRATLGAGRTRLTRQLVVEAILLAGTASVIGLLLAFSGVGMIVRLLPKYSLLETQALHHISINLPVLAFTIALSLLVGVAVSLVPALRSSNLNLNEWLKQRGRVSGIAGRPSRLQRALIVVEVALALVLLVGAGLMIQSLERLERAPAGFNPDRILTVRVPLADYKYAQGPQSAAFYDTVLNRLRTIPGVQAVGMVNNLPMTGFDTTADFPPPPNAPGSPGHAFFVATRDVSPGYFHAMGISLKRGRDFTDADNRKDAPCVRIVNESMVRIYWSGSDPVGRQVPGACDDDQPALIVGVVADSKQDSLDSQPQPEVYTPYGQFPFASFLATFVIRTSSDPMKLAIAVRQAVSDIDRDQPVIQVRTMENVITESLWRQRVSASMLGLFATIALVLAAVGIYGVFSYSVSQRTHEIGIRTTLGATRADILRMVIQEGLLLTLIGLAAGILAAVWLTRLLASLLFNIGPRDPITFITLSLLMTVVALLACYLPARRATRVDPMVALRYE